MKYLFKLETFLATVAVFIVIYVFIYFPLNLHPIEPWKIALTDINFNDLAFSKTKIHKNNKVDSNIIIINVGESDRSGIASLLNRLGKYNTKAIGVDILFEKAKDASKDQELAGAIAKIPNIILSERLELKDNKLVHYNYFNSYSKNTGYVNFISAYKSVDRLFSPVEKEDKNVNLSFAAAVTKIADKEKFEKLMDRDNETELINYRREADQYFIINATDILENKVDSSVFNQKILLLGYINQDQNNVQDKHFTPLNDKFFGKTLPDMNGVVIQANIISMILDNAYLHKTGKFLNFLIAFIFTWLFMGIAIKFFLEKHIWFHLVIKTIQALLSALLIYVGIYMLYYANSSIDFSETIVATILAGDVLYFYEGFAIWLNKKFGIPTIFNQHHS